MLQTLSAKPTMISPLLFRLIWVGLFSLLLLGTTIFLLPRPVKHPVLPVESAEFFVEPAVDAATTNNAGEDHPGVAWQLIMEQRRHDQYAIKSDAGPSYRASNRTQNINAAFVISGVQVTAADGAAGDEFGYSVSVSGDTAIVGARYEDDNGLDSGSAYIFDRNQGGVDSWGLTTKITADDGATEDWFGWSVSVSGDTVVVGAVRDDDNGDASGSAYIFTRNQGGADAWGQTAKITAADAAAVDIFGDKVSISGDTVIVGAKGDDPSGSAYIFMRNQGGADAWGQTAKITAADAATDISFGAPVSVSGDTVVVGAAGDDDNGNNSGAAYTFDRNQGGSDAWGLTAKITAADGAPDDFFGGYVSISGDTIVVGAAYDDDNGNDSGSAYIFTRNQGGVNAWGQTAKITADDGAGGDHFFLVSINGDTVVVGARYDDDNGDDSGSAYIFTRNQGGANAWGQTAKITAADGAAGDFFGDTVSVSGDTVIVGAYANDDSGDNSGSAYIFNLMSGHSSVYLPIIIKPGPTELSVHNDNTGGNITLTVVGTGVSCTVPNNTIQYCGSFTPGSYTVNVSSACAGGGVRSFTKIYGSGPQTTRIFCIQ